MRVCLVSEYFPPRISGGGEYSAYIYARSLAKRGHEVHVLTSHPRHTPFLVSEPVEIQTCEIMDGIYIHRILGVKTLDPPLLRHLCRNEFFHFHSIATIVRFIIKNKPELIHSLNIHSLLSSVVVAKFFGIPIVATVNSPVVTCPKGDNICLENDACVEKCNFTRMIKCFLINRLPQSSLARFFFPFVCCYNFFKWYLFRTALIRTDRIIAISTSLKKMLIHSNFPSHKIEVVPTAVDLDNFNVKHDRTITRKKYGLSFEDKVILFVGAIFRRRKGSHILTEAMPMVAKAIPHAKLLIVGEVPTAEKMLIQKRGMTDYVIFTGFIPNQTLPDIYATADAVVFPSIWPEPLGRVLIEAMSLEKPVVASNIGGVTDIVKDESNGLLVRPGDVEGLAKALIRILNNEKLGKKLGENGKKSITKKFHINSVTDRIVKIYKEVKNDVRGMEAERYIN